MKRIFSVLLCLLLVGTMLVGCGDNSLDEFQTHRNEYDYKPEVIPDLTLTIYVPTDDRTTTTAMEDVQRQINQYTVAQYHTTLNIVYVNTKTEGFRTDYKTTALAAAKNPERSVNIMLVNDYDMAKELYDNDMLVELGAFLDTTTYGYLNVDIASALLDAAKMEDGMWWLPNNHVIGNSGFDHETAYEYVVIRRDVVEQVFNYPYSELLGCDTAQEVQELRAGLNEVIENNDRLAEYKDKVDELVFLETGNYIQKQAREKQGYVCNVYAAPSAKIQATAASAFVILKDESITDDAGNALADGVYADRAMRIIYELNRNTYLHNLFLYGIANSNYTVADTFEGKSVVERVTNNNSYYMDPLYTGNIFTSFYCIEAGYMPEVTESIGGESFTYSTDEYGAVQNKAAVAKVESPTGSED